MHKRRIWTYRRFIKLTAFAFLVTFFLPASLSAQKAETQVSMTNVGGQRSMSYKIIKKLLIQVSKYDTISREEHPGSLKESSHEMA